MERKKSLYASTNMRLFTSSRVVSWSESYSRYVQLYRHFALVRIRLKEDSVSICKVLRGHEESSHVQKFSKLVQC